MIDKVLIENKRGFQKDHRQDGLIMKSFFRKTNPINIYVRPGTHTHAHTHIHTYERNEKRESNVNGTNLTFQKKETYTRNVLNLPITGILTLKWCATHSQT